MEWIVRSTHNKFEVHVPPVFFFFLITGAIQIFPIIFRIILMILTKSASTLPFINTD